MCSWQISFHAKYSSDRHWMILPWQPWGFRAQSWAPRASCWLEWKILKKKIRKFFIYFSLVGGGENRNWRRKWNGKQEKNSENGNGMGMQKMKREKMWLCSHIVNNLSFPNQFFEISKNNNLNRKPHPTPNPYIPIHFLLPSPATPNHFLSHFKTW